MPVEGARYLSELLSQIDRLFSLEDVQAICFDLGIDYDNVPGATKEARIRELIKLLLRREQLPALVEQLRVQRPQETWADVPAAVALLGEDPFDEKPIQRFPFEPETTRVPAGPFLMGSDADGPEEVPRHAVELPAYAIGLYPITNELYARFIREAGRVAADAQLWDGNRPPDGKLNHPVTGVTWHEAMEYCRWLSASTGRRYSLPNEAQWEKAARGPDGRRYPWGDEWLPERCHLSADTFAPVDAYPPQSVYGCRDMVGNAREWTLGLWGRDPRAPDRLFVYPWRDDRRNDPGEPPTTRRVFRGGRADEPNGYRCSARGGFLPNKPGPTSNRHGFRVVLLPS